MLTATQQDDLPTLNMTPLIDMVFLLIIFFLVGTRFQEYENEQKLDLQVPEVAAARPMVHAPSQLLIEVARDGRIRLRGEPVSLEQLAERLGRTIREDPEQAVLIRGDGRAAYQYVADVMSVCQQQGVRHLAVSVRERRQTSGSAARE